MKIPPFELERFFARYETSFKYWLSCSDCEPLSMSELLEMADRETKTLWDELKFGYTDYQGHPLLREEIAKFYSGIEAADTLVVVPEEGIFLLMHAVLEPEDHVICTFPGYQSLYQVARSIGCTVTTWEPNEDRGWHFDPGALKGKMNPNTRLVVVNFPHNPTGYLPSKEDFITVVDMVREQGAYLLSDEMYQFLEMEEGKTLPAACELYHRAFSLFGLSKTFGLPGLRIGWLATQDAEMLRTVRELKDYTTICSSAPSEILAIIALQNKSEIIRTQRSRVVRNLKTLEMFFDAYQDCFRWNHPMGGTLSFPRMHVVDDTFDFCMELAEKTGILAVPSRQFQFGNNHIRVGSGRENLPQVVDRLAAYLDQRFR